MKTHRLLDFLKKEYLLKSDRALCDALDISPPVISRIRSGKTILSADIIIVIHEKTGMSIADIKQLIKENDNEKAATSNPTSV